MPPGAFVKEEGVVPSMPTDAFVKVEVVVKEEEGSVVPGLRGSGHCNHTGTYIP